MKNKFIPGFIHVPHFLTDVQCDKIIERALKLPAKEEKFGADSGRYSHVTKVQPSVISKDFCYYKNIHKPLHKLAKDHFGFMLYDKNMTGSFLKYEVGGFTAWHHDGGVGQEYAHRKLSAVILLNDWSWDFHGGDFQFDHYLENAELADRGSLIMFPSFLFHQVTKVTKGTRFTLTYFMEGPLFV